MKQAAHKFFHLFTILPFRKAVGLTAFYGLRKLLNPDSKVFFSQHGEDSLIQSMVKGAEGFYIDVGCNHPVKESNTFRFYLQGWNGLCIDANKSLAHEFQQLRRSDKVVNTIVSDAEGELDFFEFDCDTVSTVQAELVTERTKRWNLKEVRKVKAKTLTQILEEAYPHGAPAIGLLSIDVEGHSLAALKSLDLHKYVPRLIVIEIDGFDFYKVQENDTVHYLKQHRYNLEAFDSKNGYFILEGQR